jgi:hypothetical protein
MLIPHLLAAGEWRDVRPFVKIFAATTALALASCSGGGGGSTSVTPTPTPTPAPTPTPTPVSTARVYATSRATGIIEFTTGDLDTFGLYLTLGFTARDGRYYPGYANAIAAYTGIGTAPGADPMGDYALRFKRTRVIDHETGLQIYMNAPADVRMVTPVTAMLAAPGSTASKLKIQLGIKSSLFAMVTDPDLATYDAVAEADSGDANRAADAARMYAANLRVLATMSALAAIPVGSSYKAAGTSMSLGDLRPGITPTEGIATRCLAAAPAQFVFQNNPMSSVIQCYLDNVGTTQPTPPAYLKLSTAKIQAIAHLIDGYAAAMPVRLETSVEKARWLLGINGYLRPMIGRVLADSTDNAAQAVLALTAISPTILAETNRYTEFYRYNDTGLYMPAPDFLVLADVPSLTFDELTLTGNDSVLSNDKFNTRGFDFANSAIQSVAVPAVNASELSVVRNSSGTYTVTALNGFKGVSYFDYVAKASNNEQQTTRVYVRVM